jgi:DNA-binding response OmpR family regulator
MPERRRSLRRRQRCGRCCSKADVMSDMTEPRPTRILVIDDEVTQRMLVKEYLEEAGYQVRLSEDGEHGVKIATAITPDLIIVDALLPSMDGYAVCSTLRQRTKTAGIPIILMTASKEADAIAKGFTAGATDFITKPVEWRFLADRVAYVLEKSRHMQSLHAEKSSIEEELRLTSERQPDASITEADLEKIRAEFLEEARVAREEAEFRIREAEDSADARLRVSQSAYERQLDALRNEVQKLEGELSSLKATRADELSNAQAEAEEAIRRFRTTSEAGLEATVAAYESRIRALDAKLVASTDQLARMRVSHVDELTAVRAEAEEAVRAAQTSADTRLAVATAIRDEDLHTARAVHAVDDAESRGRETARNKALWTFLRAAHAAELDIVSALQSDLENFASALPQPTTESLRSTIGGLHGHVKGLVGLTQKTNVFIQGLLEQAQLAESEFDIVAQIKRIVTRAEPACRDRGLAIRATYSTERLQIRADEAKINFVLNAFLANAVRFTPSGGNLEFSVDREPTGDLRISLGDNGIGINPGVVERLRNCLERPDLIPSSQDRKLGLSLAIATAIARQHGGRIEIDSAAGEGTIVSLIVPAGRLSGSGMERIGEVVEDFKFA